MSTPTIAYINELRAHAGKPVELRGWVYNTRSGGKIRFLKNLMGMWLLQESRRDWARMGQNYSYDELTQLAASAPALQSLIYPGDEAFLPPGNMVERIQCSCQKTGQSVPQSVGEVVRCILESLALEYRWNVEKLRELSGKSRSP